MDSSKLAITLVALVIIAGGMWYFIAGDNDAAPTVVISPTTNEAPAAPPAAEPPAVTPPATEAPATDAPATTQAN